MLMVLTTEYEVICYAANTELYAILSKIPTLHPDSDTSYPSSFSFPPQHLLLHSHILRTGLIC